MPFSAYLHMGGLNSSVVVVMSFCVPRAERANTLHNIAATLKPKGRCANCCAMSSALVVPLH